MAHIRLSNELSDGKLISGFMLDDFNLPTFGVSLRKIKSDYTGKVLKVRRSSNNDETDISFFNNEINVDDFPAMVAEPYVQEIIGEESLVELKKGEADWNPDIDEWLEIGDKRVYDGKLWKVNIAHQPDYLYPPPTVPALYSEVDFEGIIGNWRQPLGAHDAYMLGMQCYHNNELWTSQIDYNTSEPGTVPELNLWKKDGGQDPDNLCETAYPWTEDIWLTIGVDEFAKYLNKVYKCIDPAWAYLEPTNTYGYLGWIFEQDCET